MLVVSDQNQQPSNGDSWPPEVFQAFQDYLSLGSSRSVMELFRSYQKLLEGDPTVPVPALDLPTLVAWEGRYGWKVLAYQYDAESFKIWDKNRIEGLTEVYEDQFDVADGLMEKAKEALQNLPIKAMEPQDILKFAVEGAKMRKEAKEALFKLTNPKGTTEGEGDFFDTVRSLKLHQININGGNVTINP